MLKPGCTICYCDKCFVRFTDVNAENKSPNGDKTERDRDREIDFGERGRGITAFHHSKKTSEDWVACIKRSLTER